MLGVSDASADPASGRAALHYGRIVVVGGGCYGSYYVRQLGRARAAGALTWDLLTVVDRDPACPVAQSEEARSEGVRVEVGNWKEFFDSYLGEIADGCVAGLQDAIIPSPLMPHLMYDWLIERARLRWPGRGVVTRRFELAAGFRWSSEAPDGTRYVSFADWTCPINCVEPRICPHTKGERDWSMPDALRAAVTAARGGEEALKGPVIFHCSHRAYGVGMIDTADVVAADRFIAGECERGGDVLIGTVSHCHGALNVLSVPA